MKYNYQELRQAAIDNPNAENLAALADWFSEYGGDFWNGEYWDADGYTLRPIYKDDPDSVCAELIGYEFN